MSRGGQALVVAPGLPFDLAVRIGQVLVGWSSGDSERGRGGSGEGRQTRFAGHTPAPLFRLAGHVPLGR